MRRRRGDHEERVRFMRIRLPLCMQGEAFCCGAIGNDLCVVPLPPPTAARGVEDVAPYKSYPTSVQHRRGRVSRPAGERSSPLPPRTNLVNKFFFFKKFFNTKKRLFTSNSRFSLINIGIIEGHRKSIRRPNKYYYSTLSAKGVSKSFG